MFLRLGHVVARQEAPDPGLTSINRPPTLTGLTVVGFDVGGAEYAFAYGVALSVDIKLGDVHA